MDWSSSLKPDTYYKAGVYSGLGVVAAAAVTDYLHILTIGLGILFASIGEWMHYRTSKEQIPLAGGTLTTSQTLRTKSMHGTIVLGFGVLMVLAGVYSLIKEIM